MNILLYLASIGIILIGYSLVAYPFLAIKYPFIIESLLWPIYALFDFVFYWDYWVFGQLGSPDNFYFGDITSITNSYLGEVLGSDNFISTVLWGMFNVASICIILFFISGMILKMLVGY